jgi:poly-beta-hydroxyalkanoate depolymerase
MLYPIVETQRTLLKPLAMWAAGAANSFVNPYCPFAYVPGARCFAAGYELLYRLSKTYEKPESPAGRGKHWSRLDEVVGPFVSAPKFGPLRELTCQVNACTARVVEAPGRAIVGQRICFWGK